MNAAKVNGLLQLRLLLAISVIVIKISASSSSNHHHQEQQSSSGKISKDQQQQQQQQQQQHFAPKLIHQPQSATVQPNKPHTVECAIESDPEAQIRWFKEDRLLGSQPTHLEQQGSELMFFQMNEEDTGQYRCQATNYLGSISSEPFRLTVHSDEPRIRFEPDSLETSEFDPIAVFTCTIPIGQAAKTQVGWRKNGQNLPVQWLEDGSDGDTVVRQANVRFVGRQVGANQFALTILKTQLADDNSTFTCLYGQEQDQELLESSQVLLRVYRRQQQQQPMNNLDINLGAPIDGLANAKPDVINNHTTRLTSANESPSRSVQEIVRALFEPAKPMLGIVGVLALLGILVGLQLIYMRRKSCCQSNRYMKHHHHQYSSSSSSAAGCCGASSGTGGSATSSSGSNILDRDPVLSSLLGRTLSAPTCAAAAAAATLAGGSKKYRSYRDHMRKVAAVHELASDHSVVSHTDLVDSYLAQLASGGGAGNHPSLFQQQQQLHLPNLYNQSLAAREQARSLLQASEQHMRSLSNLNQTNNNNNKHLQQRAAASTAAHQFNGSHLNLPLSFANFSRANFNNTTSIGEQPAAGALWPPPHLKHYARAQQQYDEHSYQLVDCSNTSVSPSTSSSLAGGGNNSVQLRRSSSELTTSKTTADLSSSSMQQNHYSTIEPNDDDDDGDLASEEYEELDQHQQRQQQVSASSSSSSSKRISSFLDHSSGPNSVAAAATDSTRRASNKTTTAKRQQPHYPDQPSPYAVSSICNSFASHTVAPPPPPPVNSEAMRALTEQFDINQLMLHDDGVGQRQLLPPPPT